MHKRSNFFYWLYSILVFFLLVVVILLVICCCFWKKNIYFKVYRWFTKNWFTAVGIRLENIYLDNANTFAQAPCIYIANHSSYLDIPTIIGSVQRPIYFLAKAELGKIPILGFLTKKISILVERKNMHNRTKSFVQIKNHLQQGKDICIFPEGYINETQSTLLPFQRGSFGLAIQTKTPIQPIVLPDTSQRLHISSFRAFFKGKNRVIYLPIIHTEHYTENDISTLIATVHKQIENTLLAYQQKP